MNFEHEGWQVTAVSDGLQAIKAFHSQRIDVAVVDLMLPKMSGLQVVQSIRLEGITTPVLCLTAKNTTADRIAGLKTGADDYLGKPFDLEELLLRVRNLIRLKGSRGESETQLTEVQFGTRCQVKFRAFQITTHRGETRSISKRESMLLKLLITKAGKVVSREEILETVWGYDVFPSTRTIDNYILAFRKYFEVTPRQPTHFQSVRGVGYRFEFNS